jgi:tetratricopeptide (TPR) repeat protein
MNRQQRRSSQKQGRLGAREASPRARLLFDQAFEHQQAGRFAQAEARYREVLAMDPRHADSLNQLGVVHHAQGRHDAAVGAIGKAIGIEATVASYHSNLGVALYAMGSLAEAIASFRRAVNLAPDYVKAHFNLGVALHEHREFEAAVSHYQRALTLNPEDAHIHNNLGNSFQSQGNLVAAERAYRAAAALRPDYAEAYNNLGVALAAQDKLEEAAAQYERAISLRPDLAEAHYNLGQVRQNQLRFEEAAACYEKAVTLNPGYAEAHSNLGNVRKWQGRFDEASAQYKRALTIRPDDAETLFNRVESKRMRAGDPDLKTLERLVAEGDRQSPGILAFLQFALAKALDDTGDHASAFESLVKANALRRSHVYYDETFARGLLRRTAEIFDAPLLARLEGQGNESTAPIFVIGMPRSGSTLIEQILGSHPHVHPGGELMVLNQILGSSAGADGAAVDYPDYGPALDGAAVRRFAEAYLARLPALSPGQTRVTDKFLHNFMYLGMIRLMFPKARIIHTLRDPADTCLSCFTKHFIDGLNFTYDLGELGRYYRYYAELMDHWRSVLPSGAMHEVAYEDVVDDLEGQARRLLDYCGLPWDERCLSFHETRRPVVTSSVYQVRRPLYRDSLHRWRRYEAYLGPLLDELGELAKAPA